MINLLRCAQQATEIFMDMSVINLSILVYGSSTWYMLPIDLLDIKFNSFQKCYDYFIFSLLKYKIET